MWYFCSRSLSFFIIKPTFFFVRLLLYFILGCFFPFPSNGFFISHILFCCLLVFQLLMAFNGNSILFLHFFPQFLRFVCSVCSYDPCDYKWFLLCFSALRCCSAFLFFSFLVSFSSSWVTAPFFTASILFCFYFVRFALNSLKFIAEQLVLRLMAFIAF